MSNRVDWPKFYNLLPDDEKTRFRSNPKTAQLLPSYKLADTSEFNPVRKYDQAFQEDMRCSCKASRRKSGWIFYLILLLLVVIAFIVIYFYYWKK